MADDTEAREVMERLRNAAREIASAGHNGWGNAANDGADLIARLLSDLEAARKRAEAAENVLHQVNVDAQAQGVLPEWWATMDKVLAARAAGEATK